MIQVILGKWVFFACNLYNIIIKCLKLNWRCLPLPLILETNPCWLLLIGFPCDTFLLLRFYFIAKVIIWYILMIWVCNLNQSIISGVFFLVYKCLKICLELQCMTLIGILSELYLLESSLYDIYLPFSLTE